MTAKPVSTRMLLLLSFFLVNLIAYLLLQLPGRAPEAKQEAGPLLGAEETCMNCHSGMAGFSPAHAPENIGCSPCHLGNPRAEKAKDAHKDMVLIPGNLSDAHRTCGTANCHADMVHRVENSLMTTMAGVIAVDKFAFGESNSLSGDYHVKDLGMHSASDLHLRHLCASCHLGANKQEFGPIQELSRGGGCNACHLNYSKEALAGMRQYKQDGTLPSVHPVLNLQVTNDHCFGCHSRSGRISTNYEGWHETRLTREEVAGKSGFRVLQDKRVFAQMPADVHHQGGMACIDCHHPTELMGDGKRYLHEEDAVKVRCEDCHFYGKAPSMSYDELDTESRKLLALRQRPGVGKRFLKGSASGMAYYHIEVDTQGMAHFISKNTSKPLPLAAPAALCTREGAHRDVTCTSCHTAWAPQCIGCHNTFDQQAKGFDLLARKPVKGKWVEYLGEFFAEPPSLGVVELPAEKIREIQAFIPGMIMTIDKSGFPAKTKNKNPDAVTLFHRLFAPVSPHTISAKGRSCQSCHNDPLALGYGRGKLEYRIAGGKGRWTFEPDYVAEVHDGLPQDAWISFLKEAKGVSATRDNARPFTVAEQQRILTVGACLTCHKENSNIMLESLRDFPAQMRKRSAQCILPQWGERN